MEPTRTHNMFEQSVECSSSAVALEKLPQACSLDLHLMSEAALQQRQFSYRVVPSNKCTRGLWSTFMMPTTVIRLGLCLVISSHVRWAANASQSLPDTCLHTIYGPRTAFVGPSPWSHRVNVRNDKLNPQYAQTTPSEQRSFTSEVQPVVPLTQTAKKRNSISDSQWDKPNIEGRINPSPPSLSATATFLEILEAATKGLSSSVTSSNSHKRPRGRPDSVPGAMSRSTILSMNEMETNRMAAAITTKSSAFHYIDDLDKEPNFSAPYTVDPRTFSGPDNTNNEDIIKKGRGRPRKFPASSTDHPLILSKDDTDMSNAGYILHPSRSPPLSPFPVKKQKTTRSLISRSIESRAGQGDYPIDENQSTKIRKRVVKALPKAKPRRNDDSTEMTNDDLQSKYSEESASHDRVGVMMGTDDLEPPNLQRYYRTELLSSEEEYSLGIKVQFVMKCEQVHEGLFLLLDRAPSIVEWANACGFKEYDTVMNSPDFVETDVEEMIRPSKSEAIDDDMDPSMFVGNGLLNASGVGRGKGRVKKPPPLELKDYYDDTPLKFNQYIEESTDDDQSLTDDQHKTEIRRARTKIRPINRGTPRDFVNTMIAGREAKQRMVQCNMRLVVSIAKRYRHVGVNIADLVQEGSIGLTRAAEKFDPRKGFKFSTYASWWIQQAVFRSIAYHSRTIRLPVHVHNLLNRVRRVRLQLQQILGRVPTNEEMASELDMTLPKYSKMLRLTRRAISLEMPKYQNNPKDIGHESEMLVGDTIDASEVIRDENSPEQSVDQVLFHDDLQEMLKILGEDEMRVVRARYGLDDGLTRTVSTVAAQLGQSKSWVRSMECRALRKLRRPWYEKRLWEHQNSLRR